MVGWVGECLFVSVCGVVCRCVCVCVCVYVSECGRGREAVRGHIFGGFITISRVPGQLHQIIHSFPCISIV